MKKRKAVYVLRHVTLPGMDISGRLTFDISAGITDAGERAILTDVLQKLRRIGFEASPKQKEIHR